MYSRLSSLRCFATLNMKQTRQSALHQDMPKKLAIFVFCVFAIMVLFHLPLALAQTQSDLYPSPATKARLQPIVKGILPAWTSSMSSVSAKMTAAKTIPICALP
jgi:hypothetical protein